MSKTLIYLLFALMLLFIIGLHNSYFNGHQYRQDEAWDVHSALERDLQDNVILRAVSIHPPGWYLLANIWVKSFGDLEQITRLLSTGFTCLTLAFVFRLGADLFDWKIGLLAVLLLGTNLFFVVNSHEFRPYAALIAAITGSQWAFMRWLRRPKFIYALWYVVWGIGSIYFHYFGFFIVAAQGLYFLLLVRWDKSLLLRGIALFLLVGLSFSAWILPWLHSVLVATNNGIFYAVPNEWWVLEDFYKQLSHRPRELSNLLVLSGLILPLSMVSSAPASLRFRFGKAWPKIALVFIPVATTLLAFAVNDVVRHLIIRNMVVILPFAALIAALTLRALPRPIMLVAVILVLLPAAQQPMRKIDKLLQLTASLSSIYKPDIKIVVESKGTQFLAQFAYYVERRLPEVMNKDRMFYVAAPGVDFNILPAYPLHYALGNTPVQIDKLRQFVEGTREIWYVIVPQYQVDPAFENVLADEFVAVRYYPDTTRYIRRPANLSNQYIFGNTYHLQNWELKNDVHVQSCQNIQLESWWQADQIPQSSDILSLVLADETGLGVARSDGLPADLETPFWQADKLYFDEKILQIPCDVAPGAYNLLMAFYPLQETTALPVTMADGTSTGDQVYLTTVFVE